MNRVHIVLFVSFGLLNQLEFSFAEEATNSEASADQEFVYRVYAGGCSRSVQLQKTFTNLDQACDYYVDNIRSKFLRHCICKEAKNQPKVSGYWATPKRNIVYLRRSGNWVKVADKFDGITLSELTDALTTNERKFVVVRDLFN